MNPLHTFDGLDVAFWIVAAGFLWLLFQRNPPKQEETVAALSASRENLPEGFFEGDGGPL